MYRKTGDTLYTSFGFLATQMPNDPNSNIVSFLLRSLSKQRRRQGYSYKNGDEMVWTEFEGPSAMSRGGERNIKRNPLNVKVHGAISCVVVFECGTEKGKWNESSPQTHQTTSHVNHINRTKALAASFEKMNWDQRTTWLGWHLLYVCVTSKNLSPPDTIPPP